MSQRLLGYTNMSLQVELCPKKTIEKLEVRGQGQLQNILLLFTKEPQAQLQKFLMSESIPHSNICGMAQNNLQASFLNWSWINCFETCDDESPTIEPSKSVQHEEWILRNNLGSRSEISTPLKRGVCGRSLPESMFVLQGNFFLWR